ncbi:tellurite resistance/C4-dicarboxylate transporter family protein [Ornithinimicrobium tianjinense]|uniref:Tellurite resistance protein permease n=1 Tax=Ornithinimicrobium tianjinense TaxID=1195761 RepID=A0A917F9R8_9MICO|nr:tellurite resistance/C4-dicarboxylate transporter family protein [Ornithinimicrobium tianjinense]GGF60390.1 tellurite resistance protein permease [Ornithinimicrobium tianjinense]
MAGGAPASELAHARLGPARLTPGYFAAVMAPGIVSIGAQLRGFTLLALVLFWVAVALYVGLVLLTLWRFMSFRREMSEDFHDPARAFGFFTFIAATNVLGSALVGVGQTRLAAVLLTVSVLVWLVLGYVIPWTAVLGSDRRPMLDTANGTWFIWVVASQSIAVVAAGLEPVYASQRNYLAILAVFAWSVGVVLYAATAVFVALRVMLYPLRPEHLDPPYWVAMGSVAITVVAGARIVEMEDAPMIDATRDLVAGMSVVFWAFATWLIPVLVAAGVWRHFLRRIPLVYQPTLWSMVFPLGMYAVAGIYLGRADRLPVVEWIGTHWFWVALLAWALVGSGMARDLWLKASEAARR